MNFGTLRVLNDDFIAPSKGFEMHPHGNMEIITIPLTGSLKHTDNTGSSGIIHSGEVQVMSAGKGIKHSEFNPSDSEIVNLLQIWILPKVQNIDARYTQKSFSEKEMDNKFVNIVSPIKDSESLWINQDAYLYLSRVHKDKALQYNLVNKNSGVYIFVIEGNINVFDHKLDNRDGIGIDYIRKVDITANEDSYILLMEISMK